MNVEASVSLIFVKVYDVKRLLILILISQQYLKELPEGEHDSYCTPNLTNTCKDISFVMVEADMIIEWIYFDGTLCFVIIVVPII